MITQEKPTGNFKLGKALQDKLSPALLTTNKKIMEWARQEVSDLLALANKYNESPTIYDLLQYYEHLTYLFQTLKSSDSNKATKSLSTKQCAVEKQRVMVQAEDYIALMKKERTPLLTISFEKKNSWGVKDLLEGFCRSFRVQSNKYHEDCFDLIHTITQKMYTKKPIDILYLYAKGDDREFVGSLLTPQILAYYRTRRNRDQCVRNLSDIIDGYEYHAKYDKLYPTTKKIHINKKNCIQRFFDRYLEGINHEFILQKANSASNLLFAHAKILHNFFRKSEGQEHYQKLFLVYLDDYLQNQYENQHKKLQGKNGTESNGPKKAVDTPPETDKFEKQIAERIEIPPAITAIFHSMIQGCHEDEKTDALRYLRRMYTKGQPIFLDWFKNFYGISRSDTQEKDITAQLRSENIDFKHETEDGVDISTTEEKKVQPKKTACEQIIETLEEDINATTVMDYYLKQGFVFFQDKIFISSFNQMIESQSGSKNAIHRKLMLGALPGNRGNPYRQIKGGLRSMRLGSWRMIRYENIIAAVRDHPTHDEHISRGQGVIKKIIREIRVQYDL